MIWRLIVRLISLICGVFMIINGIYCLCNPTVSYSLVSYAVGWAMIFDAVGRFCNWWASRKDDTPDPWMLVGAVLSAVFAFFVLNSAALQTGVENFIVFYISIWLMCRGVLAILRANRVGEAHREFQTKVIGKNWWITLILGIIMLVFGFICMFNPVIIREVVGVFMGIGIIAAGAGLITLGVSTDDR